MADKYMIKVFTKNNSFLIPAECEIEQDGSLIKFYDNCMLTLAVQTEDFIFCQRV